MSEVIINQRPPNPNVVAPDLKIVNEGYIPLKVRWQEWKAKRLERLRGSKSKS